MTEVLLPNFSERPSDWEVSKRVRLYDNLPEFQDDLIEAAGPHFIGVITREAHPMSLYQDLAMRSILKDGNDDDEDRLPYFRAIDPPEILSSDPEDKNQDHYKILGLEEYRWKATLDDIKVAYRRKMLKYHPDKSSEPNRFYMCVQRAFMDLMNPVSRKYWDSIDPTIDESIPDFNAEGEFFSTYGPVFEREARFSLIPDVPSLGTIEDSREKIQKFYDFWVNFKTWRTFSNPAAVKDLVNPENRFERRMAERVARDSKSNEMIRAYQSRISRLVRQALALDPRLKRHTAHSARKDNYKKTQENLENERRLKLQKEEEEKIRQQEAIAAKKRNKEKERSVKKLIRRLCRELDVPADSAGISKDIPVSFGEVEKILSSKDMDQLSDFYSSLSQAAKDGKSEFYHLIFEESKIF